MNDMGYGGFGGPLLAIIGIWSFVGLGVYVWYLWALARLFPYLGLPAAHGWIPVWNQWRLIERGGLPGWTAVIGLVPGLNVVTVVMSILAIHRINQEHEEGAGMTVLGALLPPLWATMLGTRLQDRGYAADHQHRGGVRRVAGGHGLVEYGPDGQVYPLLPSTQHPARPQSAMPPLPPQSAPTLGAAAGQPVMPAAPPAAHPAATPLNPGGLPRRAEAAAAVPLPGAVPGTPAMPAAEGPAGNAWGLGNTTEGNFQRLANEPQPARGTGFSTPADARPFSWPQPTPIPPEAPLLPSPAPQVASASPQAASASLAADAPAPSTQAAEAARVPGASEPAPAAAAAQAGVPEAVADSRVTASEAAPVAPAFPPATAEAAPDVEHGSDGDSMGFDSMGFDSVAAESVAVDSVALDSVALDSVALDSVAVDSGAAESVAVGSIEVVPDGVDRAGIDPDGGEDDLDSTIVVSRRQRWVLELGDGTLLDLDADDIVLGRKPTAVGGSDTLLIADRTRTLSKSHARLRRDGETWTIEDLHSTNGVFVTANDGQQIELTPGEIVAVTGELLIGTLPAVLRVAE